MAYQYTASYIKKKNVKPLQDSLNHSLFHNTDQCVRKWNYWERDARIYELSKEILM
ncbi:hypothetical protein BY458DRAFT_515386 [Sporodiniella umbellata]|nr:hypothetical protein BY458DRAFT_515386 [Sporodiniella umbellata]